MVVENEKNSQFQILYKCVSLSFHPNTLEKDTNIIFSDSVKRKSDFVL